MWGFGTAVSVLLNQVRKLESICLMNYESPVDAAVLSFKGKCRLW